MTLFVDADGRLTDLLSELNIKTREAADPIGDGDSGRARGIAFVEMSEAHRSNARSAASADEREVSPVRSCGGDLWHQTDRASLVLEPVWRASRLRHNLAGFQRIGGIADSLDRDSAGEESAVKSGSSEVFRGEDTGCEPVFL